MVFRFFAFWFRSKRKAFVTLAGLLSKVFVEVVNSRSVWNRYFHHILNPFVEVFNILVIFSEGIRFASKSKRLFLIVCKSLQLLKLQYWVPKIQLRSIQFYKKLKVDQLMYSRASSFSEIIGNNGNHSWAPFYVGE
jgi:hypothetical protein